MAVLESRYLKDVELFECRLQTLHMVQVGRHLLVSSLVGSNELVNHQLKIRMNVNFLDPHVIGKDEFGYECLVFSFFICSTKATTYGLLD